MKERSRLEPPADQVPGGELGGEGGQGEDEGCIAGPDPPGPPVPESAGHKERREARSQERRDQWQVEREAHRERKGHPPEEPDVDKSGYYADAGHGRERGKRPEGGDGGGKTAPGAAARRRTTCEGPTGCTASAQRCGGA